MMMHDVAFSTHLLWALVMGIIVVVPFWRICTRVGFPGFLSLLVLVPLANLIFLYFLAFAGWPARTENR